MCFHLFLDAVAEIWGFMRLDLTWRLRQRRSCSLADGYDSNPLEACASRLTHLELLAGGTRIHCVLYLASIVPCGICSLINARFSLSNSMWYGYVPAARKLWKEVGSANRANNVCTVYYPSDAHQKKSWVLSALTKGLPFENKYRRLRTLVLNLKYKCFKKLRDILFSN